jgi:hypothetical protein
MDKGIRKKNQRRGGKRAEIIFGNEKRKELIRKRLTIWILHGLSDFV